MILRTTSSGAPSSSFDVAGRVGQALGVRVVGPEQHVLVADQVGEGDEVLLPERADVDVPLEHLDRILGEVLRHLLVGVGQDLEERLDPGAAVLDHRELELREPRQCAVADQRGHGVFHRPPRRQHPEGLRLEREHLAVAAHPLVGVALVAAVRRVHRDEHVVLDDLLPERVELRQAGGARAAVAPRRSGPDEHDPGAALHAPLQLLDRLVDHRQRDDRRREDAVLVVERPGLVDPLVEGVDHGVAHVGVVPHALLDEAGQGREHEGAVDALLVHQLEPRSRLAERGDRRHGLAEDLAPALAIGVAEAEVVLLRAGAGDHLEGRVRDVLADGAAHDDLRPTAHVDVVDRALVPVGQELRQRVTRLVQVVVGVEHRDVEHRCSHGSLLGRGRWSGE